MAKRIGSAFLVLLVVAGVASAQSQLRLDPAVDGRMFTYSGSTSAHTFSGGPSIINLSNYSFSYGSSSRSISYVLKFDLTGISEVLDARLIVYFPPIIGDRSYLNWRNGGNESSSPSQVNSYDLPTSKPQYVDRFFSAGDGPNGGFYSGASWDITDEIRADLPSGHSDYVIGIGNSRSGMGPGYQSYRAVFTTHLGETNGQADTQGSPFGPYVLYTPSAIPEPGTMALLGLGLVSLGVAYRRRRRKAA